MPGKTALTGFVSECSAAQARAEGPGIRSHLKTTTICPLTRLRVRNVPVAWKLTTRRPLRRIRFVALKRPSRMRNRAVSTGAGGRRSSGSCRGCRRWTRGSRPSASWCQDGPALPRVAAALDGVGGQRERGHDYRRAERDECDPPLQSPCHGAATLESSAPAGLGQGRSRTRRCFVRALPAASLTVIVTLARTRTPRRSARLTRCRAARGSAQPQPVGPVRPPPGPSRGGRGSGGPRRREPHPRAGRDRARLGQAHDDTQAVDVLPARDAQREHLERRCRPGALVRPRGRGRPAEGSRRTVGSRPRRDGRSSGRRRGGTDLPRSRSAAWRSRPRRRAPARSPPPVSCRRTGPGAGLAHAERHDARDMRGGGAGARADLSPPPRTVDSMQTPGAATTWAMSAGLRGEVREGRDAVVASPVADGAGRCRPARRRCRTSRSRSGPPGRSPGPRARCRRVVARRGRVDDPAAHRPLDREVQGLGLMSRLRLMFATRMPSRRVRRHPVDAADDVRHSRRRSRPAPSRHTAPFRARRRRRRRRRSARRSRRPRTCRGRRRPRGGPRVPVQLRPGARQVGVREVDARVEHGDGRAAGGMDARRPGGADPRHAGGNRLAGGERDPGGVQKPVRARRAPPRGRPRSARTSVRR